MKIGMIGLGKLGLPVAEAMATHYTVYGYDVNPAVKSNTVNIVDSVQDTVKNSDIVFIAVQTPHDPKYDGSTPSSHLDNKDFDYSYVKAVLQQINSVATASHIIVLISTVLPGTTRRELANLITQGELIYNPYLIAMGSVASDMVNPEMIMIGNSTGANTNAVTALKNLYAPLMQNNPRIITGTWEEVESIKIFYNTFISAKLSLVNMIQDVAERIGNMNVDIVATALSDSTYRIMGPAYMKPGMGDGGPCHPRDNIALRWLAERLDLGYDLFDAIMTAREVQAKNLAVELHKHQLPIVILGKSFKPGVPYTDGSYGMLVGYYCKQLGSTPSYDTVLAVPAVYLLGHNVDYDLTAMANGSVVIDPWRTAISKSGAVKVIHYGNTRRTNTAF